MNAAIKCSFPPELRHILDAVVAHCIRRATIEKYWDAEDLIVGNRVAEALASLGYDLSPKAGVLVWGLWSLDQAAGFLCCDPTHNNDHQPILNSLAVLCEDIESGCERVTMADITN
jgi:hypothetical protein